MKRIFIGSSSADSAKEKANVIKGILEELGTQPVLWSDTGVFILTDITIDRLIELAHEFDAGVFIFDNDDTVLRDGAVEHGTRDNVIAEAGMFASVLGRTSMVMCHTRDVHIPTDFNGITRLEYKENRDYIKSELNTWVDKLPTRKVRPDENNVLMLKRQEIHRKYTLKSRLRYETTEDKGGKHYGNIQRIRLMNLACNLVVNPYMATTGHRQECDVSLTEMLEEVLTKAETEVEMILPYPSKANLADIETKIANRAAASPSDLLLSSLATLYNNLNSNTIYRKQFFASPQRFRLYLMKTSIPFGIFGVDYGENPDSHVKVDLYSAVLDEENNRRSFVIWRNEDKENYSFFIDNFDAIKNNKLICYTVGPEALEPGGVLKTSADKWEAKRKMKERKNG